MDINRRTFSAALVAGAAPTLTSTRGMAAAATHAAEVEDTKRFASTFRADGVFDISKVLKRAVTVSAVCLWVVLAQRAMADHILSSGESDASQIERGRYLVKISGCNDCHTAGYAAHGGKIPESQWLLGDTLGWRGPWGTTYPSNLRLFINSLTEDQWVKFSEAFQAQPPMPWWLLHDMNREDRGALYAYVRWLGPAGGPAPSFVPPEQEPVGAVVQFPAPLK
jgi:mono/diheme cytochrome c family protein